ncbi:MAG: hypothetical protein JWQ98_1506 [Chlorobi bacterium]|nr:hypothetical protein [Chlorobiota bacterium]
MLFVRDERLEAAAKPLPGLYRRAGYRSLNNRILSRTALLAASGIDLIVAGEGNAAEGYAHAFAQRGASFGERITNAISDAFAIGYEQVVVIGNDCPELAPSDITDAFQRLGDGATLVAAPARDGGAYLLAARSGTFDPEAFLWLPWQTGKLFEAIGLLPGSASLATIRDDFDDWAGRRAMCALGRLFAHHRSLPAVRLHPAPAIASARLKALARIHLPAPPSY